MLDLTFEMSYTFGAWCLGVLAPLCWNHVWTVRPVVCLRLLQANAILHGAGQDLQPVPGSHDNLKRPHCPLARSAGSCATRLHPISLPRCAITRPWSPRCSISVVY